MAIDPVLAASVRAYVARDWGRFERERDQALRMMSIADRLRQVDSLRAGARLWQPAWPTEADREADLEAHQRLAAQLARTRGAEGTAKRGPGAQLSARLRRR